MKPLIIARQGSKGIPNKNSRTLSGRPLLRYTVDWALEEGLKCGDIYLYTDCETLSKQGRILNLNTSFKRNKDVSSDKTTSWDTIKSLLTKEEFKDVDDDYCILMQLTVPFRQKGLINAVRLAIEEQGADSGFTCFEVPHMYAAEVQFEEKEDKSAVSYGQSTIRVGKHTRRQDIKTKYIRNGSLYFFNISKALEENTIYPGKCVLMKEEIYEHYVN